MDRRTRCLLAASDALVLAAHCRWALREPCFSDEAQRRGVERIRQGFAAEACDRGILVHLSALLLVCADCRVLVHTCTASRRVLCINWELIPTQQRTRPPSECARPCCLPVVRFGLVMSVNRIGVPVPGHIGAFEMPSLDSVHLRPHLLNFGPKI